MSKAYEGILAGAFDIIHPGYIRLFKDAKTICENLIIALHKDPSLENPSKMKPIFSVDERIEILQEIRQVDGTIVYETEKELGEILREYPSAIRIVGSDYIYMGIENDGIENQIIYHNRNHDWSSTKLKKMIYESYREHINE